MDEIIDKVTKELVKMENLVIEVDGLDGDTIYIKLRDISSMVKYHDALLVVYQEGHTVHRFRATSESWDSVLKIWRGE